MATAPSASSAVRPASMVCFPKPGPRFLSDHQLAANGRADDALANVTLAQMCGRPRNPALGEWSGPHASCGRGAVAGVVAVTSATATATASASS